MKRTLVGKWHKRILFFVPLLYGAIFLFAISDDWAPCDDCVELGFVQGAESVSDLLGTDTFGYFRPIKNILFFAFSCLSPFVGVEGCRVFAIGIGILSFFAVIALYRRVFENEWKALFAASVWILAPTLVSSVAWLSSLNIQIMVMCTASAIVLHDSAWDDGTFRTSRIVLAAVLLFLALVSYECAIAAVPILLVFDWLLRPGRLQTHAARWSHAGYWAVSALYLCVRLGSTAKFVATGSWVEAERWQLVVSSPWLTAQHFATWFWPFGRFTVLGSYLWGDTPAWMLAGCAALGIGILAFAFFSRKRTSVLSFCILFAALGFAPVSNCLGSGNGPYGDYYLTLASIGLAAGCVELAFFLSRTKGVWRWPAVSFVVLFGATRVAAVVETARWANLWNSGIVAFEESFRNFPKFLPNRMAILEKSSNDGHYEQALTLAQEIEREIRPGSRNMQLIHIVRALYALNVEKDAEKAMAFLDRFGELASDTSKPRFSTRFFHYYRGCVFEDLEDNETKAMKEYETALQGKWGVDLVPCADRLARLKAVRGELVEAIALWEKALKFDPENEAVAWNLSTAYRNAGEIGKSNALRMRLESSAGKRRL